MKRLSRERVAKLVNQPGDPLRLALAFAMGILLGVLPGTGAVMAAALATVFRLNIPLAVAGALLTNPLTAPLVYAGSYFIGRALLGKLDIEQTITRVLLTTIAGNVVLALGMAVVGFLSVWGLAVWYRSGKR